MMLNEIKASNEILERRHTDAFLELNIVMSYFSI